MIDCNFALNSDGFFQCQNPGCGWIYPQKDERPPHRNCPNSPSLKPAAEKLGIKPADIKHYAQALARWTVAGWPTRDQTEVERIESDLCRPCKEYNNGRCSVCKCGVSKSRMALANKIKMATESCPRGKW